MKHNEAQNSSFFEDNQPSSKKPLLIGLGVIGTLLVVFVLGMIFYLKTKDTAQQKDRLEQSKKSNQPDDDSSSPSFNDQKNSALAPKEIWPIVLSKEKYREGSLKDNRINLGITFIIIIITMYAGYRHCMRFNKWGESLHL